MVLRMTGASWLATMMRASRDRDEPQDETDWLLHGPTDPDVVEDRRPAND